MGAFGSVGVLTQLWCARVPAVAALVGCFTLALHGTRRPCTAVQLRVGVGVALFAPCRPAYGVTVRPWWPDMTPVAVVWLNVAWLLAQPTVVALCQEEGVCV